MGQLENKFHSEMLNIYETSKKELKYNPTRFLQLVSKIGGIAAAKQLISKDDGTYGFGVLWEHSCLDLSVEVLVLREEFSTLFTKSEKKQCKDRLLQYGYTFE